MAWIVYVVRYVFWLAGRLRRRFRTPPPYVSFLLEGPSPEVPDPPGPRWRRLLGRPQRSQYDFAGQLRVVMDDPRVRGVVLHLRAASYSPAQAETLAGLIGELRAAGKRVVCWASSYTTATYRVACVADEILIQPGGQVANLGFRRRYLFLADALDRAGVEADMLQVSPYKTAADVLTRREMSAEAREMAGWLADSHFDELVAAIASGRRIEAVSARALVDGSPYTDLQAKQAGAVDDIVGEEALPARLGAEVRPFDGAGRAMRIPPPLPPGRYVGLLRIEGMILDGRSRRAPVRPPFPIPFLFEEQAGDVTVVQQARQLARDRRAAAVLLWVDSGGGSATASEAMAAALTELAARKPLVAVMGSVAGSGGYYVVTPAHRVFAQPGTLTGSIGVLGGKVVMGRLLDRLLLNREVVARGAHATMFEPDRPFSDQERARLGEWIARVYQLFLDRVSRGRQRPVAQIEPIAGGRVWTGRQALDRGLIDELGGLPQALAAARRLGGLPPRAPLRELPLRGEVAPLQPAVGGALEHALRAAAAFNHAGAWLLCPLIGTAD